jgi:membrane associated rhomboid family serine protease
MIKHDRPGRGSRNGNGVLIAMPNLRGTVTLWVIVTCVGVYVGLALLNLLGIWPKQLSCSWLGLSRTGLSHGMVWQMVTSLFLHFNVPHLFFNMLVLAFLGVDVEQRLGQRGYVVFSLACGLAGSAGFLLLGHAQTIGAGYSGVIYGVMAACAVFWPDRIICMFYFFPMKMKWAMLLMALTALFLTIEPGDDAIAHAAHLGGALAGFVYVKCWPQREMRKQVVTVAEQEASRPLVKDRKRKQIPTIRVPDEL